MTEPLIVKDFLSAGVTALVAAALAVASLVTSSQADDLDAFLAQQTKEAARLTKEAARLNAETAAHRAARLGRTVRPTIKVIPGKAIVPRGRMGAVKGAQVIPITAPVVAALPKSMTVREEAREITVAKSCMLKVIAESDRLIPGDRNQRVRACKALVTRVTGIGN